MKLSKCFLDLREPPICRLGPNPRITNKQVERNTNRKNTKRKVFILWFSLPPRLAYVHVFEEATQAFWVSFNPILVLKSREQSLEMRGDLTRWFEWLQTSRGYHISWKLSQGVAVGGVCAKGGGGWWTPVDGFKFWGVFLCMRVCIGFGLDIHFALSYALHEDIVLVTFTKSVTQNPSWIERFLVV